MKRVASIAMGSLLSLALITVEVAAQNQTQSSSQSGSSATTSGTSLGDYARQIRKNSSTPGKPKVFDNDNLPKDDKLSIVGQASTSDGSSEAKTDDSSSPNAGADENKGSGETKAPADAKAADQPSGQSDAAKNPPQDPAEKDAAAKQWQDKISAQKDSVDLVTRELNVLQGEYQLRAAAFYADAGNRLRNQSAWDQEDAKYKQEIADKQKSLDDAKQKLDDLQEEARKAGMPSSVSEQQ